MAAELIFYPILWFSACCCVQHIQYIQATFTGHMSWLPDMEPELGSILCLCGAAFLLNVKLSFKGQLRSAWINIFWCAHCSLFQVLSTAYRLHIFDSPTKKSQIQRQQLLIRPVCGATNLKPSESLQFILSVYKPEKRTNQQSKMYVRCIQM